MQDRHLTDREGIARVGLLVPKELKWIFREQSTSDFGIDGHIEIWNEGEYPSGKLLGTQVKSGTSYFSDTTENGWIYRGDLKHLEYWLKHSLPIIVIIHNPGDGKCYWQVVSEELIHKTKEAWKIEIPQKNLLDKYSKNKLENINKEPKEILKFRRLESEKGIMEMIEKGGKIILEVDEWIHKSSGRGSLGVFSVDVFGEKYVWLSWPIFYIHGKSYKKLIPTIFPWANLKIDKEIYIDYDMKQYEDECGLWDSETKSYMGYTESFNEWYKNKFYDELRPYEIDSDEVAKWRLVMELNELGRAFILLHKYLYYEQD